VKEPGETTIEALSTEREDPVEQIRAGLRAFVETMAVDDRRLKVNFVEMVGATPAAEKRRREAIAAFRALMISQVEHFIDRGLHRRATSS
jgi:hypothetical protein